MWRKPVTIRRVTLTAEFTLASVYFTRKKLILLPEPKGKADAPVGRASGVGSSLEFRLRLSGCLSR